MIQSTKGKLAADAVNGHYGKGFPRDLAKRTRAMLSAQHAASVLEDLRFPPGNNLEDLKGAHNPIPAPRAGRSANHGAFAEGGEPRE